MTKKYGDIIELKSTNDYKNCSCGVVAIDVGKDSLKKLAMKNMKNFLK
jgi:hypothetical protein